MARMSTVVLVGVWLFTASIAHGQTLAVSVGAGVGQLWDDETLLGKGPVVSGGLAARFGEHVRVSADVDWLSHTRRLTYLSVDGHATSVLARLTYVFGSTDAGFSPLLGSGVGLMHSTGTLETPSVVVMPDGRPVLTTVPMDAHDWSLTRPMWEAHAGLRIRAGRGVALEPEVRWRSTFGPGASSGIEPPLLGMQGLVRVVWEGS